MKMDANENKAFDKDSMVELYSAESGNRYRILCEDDRDGLGKRWKGRDLKTGRIVTITACSSHGCDYEKELFKRLRRHVAKCRELKDDILVGYYDVFTADPDQSGWREFVFLISEWLPDFTQKTIGRLLLGRRTARRGEILRAFSRYAHAVGVVCANGLECNVFCPEDLYFPGDGNPSACRVRPSYYRIDPEAGAIPVERIGGAYLPPEVFDPGLKEFDARSRIFALGLVLYEALTGKCAYPSCEGKTCQVLVVELFRRAKERQQPNFDALDVSEDRDLLRLLREMTEIDREKRIADPLMVERRLSELADLAFRNETPFVDDESDSGRNGLDVRVIDDGLEMLYGCRPYRPLIIMRRKNAVVRLVFVSAVIIVLIWFAWWFGKVI